MADDIKPAPTEFPSAFTVHWATGPVQACVLHARALVNMGRHMGLHVAATAPAEGGECANCRNNATFAATHPETP